MWQMTWMTFYLAIYVKRVIGEFDYYQRRERAKIGEKDKIKILWFVIKRTAYTDLVDFSLQKVS